MNNKIWKDIHLFKLIGQAFCGFLLLYGIYFVVNYSIFRNAYSFFLLVVMNIPLIYFFLTTSVTRLTDITFSGIRIGNSHNGAYTIIHFKRKAMFIQWKDIEHIQIIRKVVRPGIASLLKSFIIVKVKGGGRYECFIARPESFLKTLEQIKRSYLLKKKI